MSEKITFSDTLNPGSPLGEKFQDLKQHLKETTNHKKRGNAATVRMALRMAWKRLQHQENVLDAVDSEQYRSIHGEDR